VVISSFVTVGGRDVQNDGATCCIFTNMGPGKYEEIKF
jgi:hypothetical protein